MATAIGGGSTGVSGVASGAAVAVTVVLGAGAGVALKKDGSLDSPTTRGDWPRFVTPNTTAAMPAVAVANGHRGVL
jgi:hypothetical protein